MQESYNLVIQKDTGWQTAILSLYAWVLRSFSIEDELEYKISLLKVRASGNNYVCCGSVLSFGLNFIFLCLGIVMYDNEFETKKNKIQTKDKISMFHHIPKIEKRKKTSLRGV